MFLSIETKNENNLKWKKTKPVKRKSISSYIIKVDVRVSGKPEDAKPWISVCIFLMFEV